MVSVVIGSVLVTSPALAQKKNASAAGASAMTKEQAQSLVVKKHPGARVTGAEQKTVNGKSVWVVRFMETGGNTPQQVQVDETGKLTRM